MKIVSCKSLGVQKVYSPEMESSQHNYITGNSNAIHKNSHAVSYCLVAHRCLWLKAHFAPEWWAAVMSDCHQDKLVRYMGIARSEKWKPTPITYSGKHRPDKQSDGVTFDTLNLENMTRSFTVTGDIVNQGLIGIKGIGETAADKYEGKGEYTDIDDFIEKTGGKDKAACERFIKLGAFKYMPGHANSKAVWTWYQYKYCSGKDITALRKDIKQKLLDLEGWNTKTIEEERKRQIAEYRRAFPNRRKIPAKFINWNPKPNDTRDNVMSLVKEDFTLQEILQFEEDYLGYYLHSPLDMYIYTGGCSIDQAKIYGNRDTETRLEGVIVSIDFSKTKTNKDFAKIVVSDGIQQTMILMWESEMRTQCPETLEPGTGVQVYVNYDETRNIFTVARNSSFVRLKKKPVDI